jgi:hypothetical protein
LQFKQTWALAIGKFLTDGVWWFYLFWLPDFLHEQYQLAQTEMALADCSGLCNIFLWAASSADGCR